MNKKVKLLVSAILLVTPMACEDPFLSVEDKAKKAATEFCECMRNNSRSTCEDKLNAKYDQYAGNKDFMNTFNRVNTCNATISTKTK